MGLFYELLTSTIGIDVYLDVKPQVLGGGTIYKSYMKDTLKEHSQNFTGLGEPSYSLFQKVSVTSCFDFDVDSFKTKAQLAMQHYICHPWI